ncbi:MAG: ABC transporter ATP-binding protein [Chitinophagaceae bacterium]|nr:ABC transporter ATP-binding protein [Chitinophagaceae bacterium]
MNEPIVRIQSITKQYKGSSQPAINDLSLQILPGSVFGLLGPNGAGKSTLVMMLCGLMRPDTGSIHLLGMDTKEKGAAIRKRIGVAPQEIALFPTLTAMENLVYFGKMYGLDIHTINKRIADHLEIFGLADKSHKRVHTFSGGMKRRLNLIAALLHDPGLLILDEPTAGVDTQSRNILLDFLISLKEKNISIIYSSHLLEEAEKICTHIAIIDEGRLVTEGVPAALIEKHADCPSLESLFLKLTGKHIRD